MIATYTYFKKWKQIYLWKKEKNPIKYPMAGTITQKTKGKAKEGKKLIPSHGRELFHP
jgi:transposase